MQAYQYYIETIYGQRTQAIPGRTPKAYFANPCSGNAIINIVVGIISSIIGSTTL
jgi:hypothetical protein